jgi:hypothetical protein
MALKAPGFKFLAVALVFATVLVVVVSQVTKTEFIPIRIVLAIPDDGNLSGTIDGSEIDLFPPETVIDVEAGNHTLVIKKAGYNDFTANFTAEKGQPLTITAAMKRNSIPQFTSLQAAQPSDKVRDWQATKVEYFGNHDWAFVFAKNTPTEVEAFFLLRYDDAKKAWVVHYGPDSLIPDEDANTLPSDLQQYLRKNYYVSENAYEYETE